MVVFYFKQKTTYEMRISDWSSDVCSSDLAAASGGALAIFFCHGFAFAIYGVLLGALEFGRWLHARERTVGGLGRTAALLAAQAVIPVVLFLRMPTSSAEGQSGSTLDAIRQHASGGTLAERRDFGFWYRRRTLFQIGRASCRERVWQ